MKRANENRHRVKLYRSRSARTIYSLPGIADFRFFCQQSEFQTKRAESVAKDGELVWLLGGAP